MPDILPLSRTPLRDSIANAMAKELERVPENSFEVRFLYDDGGAKVSTAYRIDRERWAVSAGAFVHRQEDAKADFGIFGSLTVKF
jgi:hypothetical protein